MKDKMKTKINVMAVGLTLVAATGAYAAATETVTGSVKTYLMNPEGSVDGFLLSDGVQIHFPPHMSKSLVGIVKPNDKVSIKGERESSKLVRADSITNVGSGKTVVETPPALAEGARPEPPPPGAGPSAGPGMGPHERRMKSLEAMKADGQIQTALYGRRGEVNGALLTDGTIVHYSPKVAEDSKIKTDAGSRLKASGFGTKNEYGRSLEATEISN